VIDKELAQLDCLSFQFYLIEHIFQCLRLHGFVLGWIALLFFGFLFDFFVRLKELSYVARNLFGDFVDFTASLFYVFIECYALLDCRYCG
jgi:hypothetical protein